MKTLAVLGSTGSIGVNVLDVVRQFPERYRVVALAAGTNVERLARQVEEFAPSLVSVCDEQHRVALLNLLPPGHGCTVLCGTEGNMQVASHEEAVFTVSAMVGALGLLPTLAAIEAGKDIGLANKETLVMAGQLVMRAVEQAAVQLLPIDSEHSAIFQALEAGRRADLRKILLTASGGPFRGLDSTRLAEVTAAEALRHPNWSMGRKISIDSATLMNKGLEVIEARWLFDLPEDRIGVVVHPQSIIHSMVEYRDSSILAQMGLPDMRLPIHYAFNYPQREPSTLPRLDFSQLTALTFEAPDTERFPCLALAYGALRAGGTMPCVLNAANEAMVARYLAGEVGFYAISEAVERVMASHDPIADYTLEDLLALDAEARRRAVTGEGGRF